MERRFNESVDYLIANRLVYNATDLAKILSKQKSYISELLSGKRKLSERFIHEFCEQFPMISGLWLLTGEGEMLVDGAYVINQRIGNGSNNNTQVVEAGGDEVSMLKEQIKLLERLLEEKERTIQILMNK